MSTPMNVDSDITRAESYLGWADKQGGGDDIQVVLVGMSQAASLLSIAKSLAAIAEIQANPVPVAPRPATVGSELIG